MKKKERIKRSSKKNRKTKKKKKTAGNDAPAVKIFQGGKPVSSHGFFFVRLRDWLGSRRQMAGTYAPEILRRVWKEVRSAISDPWFLKHQ